jgi:hypothetical protein
MKCNANGSGSSDRPKTKRFRFPYCSASVTAAGIVGLLLCGVANAGVILQDFESYADSTALNADISFIRSNTTVSLSMTESVSPGSQSLKLTGNNGVSPFFSQAELLVPLTSLYGVSSVDLWFKSGGGSGERLLVQLKDEFGTTLATSTAVPRATQNFADWTLLSIDTSATTSGLRKVALFLQAQDFGTGNLYIDSITTIPEPATLGFSGLGALMLLALRQRRR